MDTLRNENGDTPQDAGATGNGVGRGLESVSVIKDRDGRGGSRPGSGRKPKAGTVASVPLGPPPEQFKPEDVLPAIEVPFKLASVALRSDAVDLEEDEKVRLGRTGATAANYWLAVSPKAFTGIIFLTSLTQVVLAKLILFKAEQKDKADALARAESTKSS